MPTRLFLACLILLAACKPDKDKQVAPTPAPVDTAKRLSIHNEQSVPLNCKLYYGRSDFMNDTNPFIDIRLAPDSTYYFAAKDMKQLDSIYADIYSDDYTLTKWPGSGPFKVEFPQGYVFYNIYTDFRSVDNRRHYFMNTNDTVTRWHAVWITHTTQHFWDSLPSFHKDVDLELYKTGEFKLEYFSHTGTPELVNGKYSPLSYPDSLSRYMLNLYVPYGNFTSKMMALNADLAPFVADSAVMYVGWHNYIFVREH